MKQPFNRVAYLSVFLLLGCDQTRLVETDNDFRIHSHSPAESSTNVEPDDIVEVTLTNNLPLSATSPDLLGLSKNGAGIQGSLQLNSNRTLTFTPQDTLILNTSYDAFVDGSLSDIDGNPLDGSVNWTFKTRDGAWGDIDAAAFGDFEVIRTFIDAQNRHWLFTRVEMALTNEREWVAAYEFEDDNWSELHVFGDGDDFTASGKINILSLVDGDILLVWEEESNTLEPSGLRFSRFDTDTESWSETQTAVNSANSTFDPDLFQSNNLDIVMAYRYSGFGSTGIDTATYHTETNSWSTGVTLDNLIDSVSSPAVAERKNSPIVSWLQGNDVFVSQYDANEDLWGVPESISNPLAGAFSSIMSFAQAPDEELVLIWGQADPDSGTAAVSASHSSADGWSVAEMIPGCVDCYEPVAVVGPDGETLAVMRQQTAMGDINLVYSVFKEETQQWTTVGPIETEVHDVEEKHLILSPSGEAFVYWLQSRSGTFEIDGGVEYTDPTAIWSSRFDFATTSWSSPEVLTPTGGIYSTLHTYVNDYGVQSLIWERNIGFGIYVGHQPFE